MHKHSYGDMDTGNLDFSDKNPQKSKTGVGF